MTTQAVALAEAGRVAGLAPSIHNTQPWHWQVRGSTLCLYAARARQLAATDPEGRMLVISCGAALHHAQVALAAAGWGVTVARVPDDAQPDLLAQLTLTEHGPTAPEAMRDLQTIELRHTDRRPVTDTPVDQAVLDALAHVARVHGAHLHILRRDDVIELASAAARAQSMEGMDADWVAELGYWAGGQRGEGARAEGLGVPADAIPATTPETTVPARDFASSGTLAVAGAAHDRAAVYAVLFGDEDTALGWLQGGEALSAVWLAAVEHGLALVPLSAAAEVPTTRFTLKRLAAGLGEPYLALRLGVPDPDHPGPAHTPRLPAEVTVEIVSS